jgi:hypothetical protein
MRRQTSEILVTSRPKKSSSNIYLDSRVVHCIEFCDLAYDHHFWDLEVLSRVLQDDSDVCPLMSGDEAGINYHLLKPD